mgnify:FL=1
MKNLFIFAALVLGMATLNSCTQEDTTEVPVESRMKPASNMRELTEQLNACSDIAYRGIQIAFASIQYSESMTYTSINAE